jgi:hypothetical protein
METTRMPFATPARPHRRGVWPRVLGILEDGGDADGWVSRADLMARLGNVRAETLVGALNTHQEELERRVVGTATRPREEFRLRGDAA